MHAFPVTARKILTTLVLCAPALTAGAQSGFVERMDGILAARRERMAAKYDTAYIRLPEKKWTVKLRTTMQGTDLDTKGKLEGMSYRSMLKTDISAILEDLGYTANDLMNVNFVFIVEGEYGGENHDVGAGNVKMKLLEANAYYSFNRRRFSFPAVFTGSQEQRRSCGTWLAAMSAFAGKFTTGDGTIPGLAGSELSVLNVAVGAGYAYNFALRRKWLLHLSATPQLVVFSRARLLVDGDRQRAPFKFPAIANVGRIAAVHSFGNSFMGFYAVVNTWNMGDRDKMGTSIIKWRIRLFYGIRF